MNKNIIRGFAIFVVGVGVGTGGTVLFLKNKYESIVQEEIASIREVAERTNPVDGYPDSPNPSKVLVMSRDRYKKIARQYGSVESEAATTYFDPVETEHPVDSDEEYDKCEDMSCGICIGSDTGAPYIISLEEFSEGTTNFDKISICYYEDDDTLADENEEIITDVSTVIGDDALTSFGQDSEDPEVVYVRNEQMSIDYEVVRLSKSYQETVLGIKKSKKRVKKVVSSEETTN